MSENMKNTPSIPESSEGMEYLVNLGRERTDVRVRLLFGRALRSILRRVLFFVRQSRADNVLARTVLVRTVAAVARIVVQPARFVEGQRHRSEAVLLDQRGYNRFAPIVVFENTLDGVVVENFLAGGKNVALAFVI